MKSKKILNFTLLVVLFFFFGFGSFWFWNLSVVLLGMAIVIISLCMYSYSLFSRNQKTYSIVGFAISFLLICFFVSFSYVVVPVISEISDGYLDKIYYEENKYVGVSLDAGFYSFILNEKTLGIFRDQRCVCKVFAGPSKDVTWKQLDGEKLTIYVDEESYLWSLGNIGSDNECLECDL